MTFTNHIIPFQLGQNQVRGSIVRLETTVSDIIKRHHYPRNIESLLADTLTITACLGSRMKHDGIFTIQAKGTAEVHTLFSDITNDGCLRGYVGFEDGYSKKDTDLSALMGSGHISFTLDQGKYSKRYQGIIALDEKTISKSAEVYFNNSEQLETRFSNFNFYNISKANRKKMISSGLIMLQKMPSKDYLRKEEDDKVWEDSLNFLSTLRSEEFLSINITSQDILFRLFNEVGVRIYDEIIIKDQCKCSQAKVELAIKNLNKKELMDISDENGNIKVVCEFCNIERNILV